jgi:protein phosphatase
VTVLAELEAAVEAGKVAEIDKFAALASVVGEVLRRLDDLAARDSGMYGMGTTITALLWNGATVSGMHIGDSRAYRWRAGELQMLTQDHTLVQSLLDSGRITEQEAAEYPRRNLLARAVQTGSFAEPDVFAHEARVGDRYLICSDGLTAVLTDETIAGVLTDVAVPDDAVDQFIDLALRGGAPDNVSVVLADVSENPRSGYRKYFRRHSR